MFQFEINGMKFHILETPKGYRWMPPVGTGRIFASLFEAQEDAIKTMQNYISVENHILGWDDYHDERRHEDDK